MICSRISWGAASSCCKMVCYCGVVNIYHSCQQHTFHGLVYHVFELLQLFLACDSITSFEYSDSLLQSCIYLHLRLIQDSFSSNSKHLMITSHDMGTSKTKSFEIKRNSCIRNFMDETSIRATTMKQNIMKFCIQKIMVIDKCAPYFFYSSSFLASAP